MCEMFSSAPTAIKSALTPILATMGSPNMVACCDELESQRADHRLVSQVRQWVNDTCRQCDVCGVPASEVFDFTADMSVGNESIDSDHRAFFDLARLLHETPPGPEHGQVALSAIGILEEYVMGHFLREEKAMRAVRYPRLAQHRHRHEIFRGRIKAIAEVYRLGTTSVADELPSLVARWLRGHILDDDSQYKNWINTSSVDSRPLVFLAIEAEQHRKQ